MQLKSIQFAVFTNELIQRPDLLFQSVNSKLNSIIDDMPMIVNLPANIQADLPIVQANSIDKRFAMNVSRTRVDFFINCDETDSNSTPASVFKTNRELFRKYFKAVLEEQSIVRVGLVITMFKPITENVKSIYEKYLTEKYSLGSQEVTLRINDQSLLKGITLNNIRLVQSAVISEANENTNGVVIQLDINNVPSERQLTADFVSAFLGHVAEKVKDSVVQEMI